MTERSVENLTDTELIMNSLALLMEQPVGGWSDRNGPDRMMRVYKVHDELVRRSSTGYKDESQGRG